MDAGYKYQNALLNVGGSNQVLATETRKSDHCIIDDPLLAEEIWHRIVSILEGLDDSKKELLYLEKLQTPIIGAYPISLNEQLRFLCYNPT
jgi:hypothetical protein